MFIKPSGKSLVYCCCVVVSEPGCIVDLWLRLQELETLATSSMLLSDDVVAPTAGGYTHAFVGGSKEAAGWTAALNPACGVRSRFLPSDSLWNPAPACLPVRLPTAHPSAIVWQAFSGSMGYTTMKTPSLNKGLGFTNPERDALGLRGLLPPATLTLVRARKRGRVNRGDL